MPLFPLAARLRSEPDLGAEAMAIFAGNGGAARLIAANRRARRGGLRPGMSLAEARALLPNLSVRARDAECERAARECLVEIAEIFSPRVEDAGEGTVFLDLTGLERHHDGELAIARELMLRTEKAELPAWAGIASSKLAARVASETPRSPVVVAPRREADFLAALPIARLGPEARLYDTLQRWGIRSVGELAALPANEVAARLGAAGQKLHEQARGMDRHPLVPRPRPAAFHEGMVLDWPLLAIEPFLFIARAALERLCRRLEGHGLACSRLALSLRLEPHGNWDRSVLLPAPSRDVKTLLTLVRLDLERRPPGAPVIGFAFTAHPDRPRETQLALFGPTALSPEKLATTLARLFSLLGPRALGSPRPVDGHRPERFELVEYRPPPPADFRPPAGRGKGLLAARVLRPPVALEVETGGRGRRRWPRAIRSPAGSRPAIGGAVRVASGPWSLEEGWWEETPVERDYWDVELEDGGVYRIFRRRRQRDWFADGVYD